MGVDISSLTLSRDGLRELERGFTELSAFEAAGDGFDTLDRSALQTQKTAIMDQFNVHVREGMPRHMAMVSAACERLRPIVMITLAAVLGMLPLAFGRGIGAEMRNAIGIASAGGILVSGVLTLLVLPILYDLFTREGKTAP